MASSLLRIRDLAEGQWGLVTLRQARAAGVGWQSIVRLTDTGLLERVAHGVYRVRGAVEPDHLGLRAAWLQLDPARPTWDRLGDPTVSSFPTQRQTTVTRTAHASGKRRTDPLPCARINAQWVSGR